MRVIDTSAWIEWLKASPTAVTLKEHWPEASQTIVPTLVQLELAKWLTRELSEEAADQVIAYTMGCLVVPLETRIALRAADICRSHKLATADAIIYATAIDLGADCLTCDNHFSDLPGVIFVAKSQAL